MAINRMNLAMRPLWRAVWADNGDGVPDGQLLARFVTRRDEAAFAALVRRHGPMVLGVCRRVLGNAADAEDAFQATFIVLLDKAVSLKSRAVLGDYLHGIARRTALKAKVAAAHRRAKEQGLARSVAQVGEDRNDWLPILDEELSRLPEKYRLPIVLCDLEGRTRGEAAGQLGWPEGTVAGRLARGRALLAKRLLRGAQFHAGVLPGTLAGVVAQAALSPGLLQSTVQAAASVTAGKAAATAALSPGALTLAQGVLQTMLWNKLKIGVIVLLAAACTAGIGAVTYRVVAGEGQAGTAGIPQDGTPRSQPVAAATAPRDKETIVRELDLRGFQPVQPKDTAHQQDIIDGEKDLAASIPDKDWQKKIAGQVDFEKERLLYFAWSGSPQDKLSFEVEKEDAGLVVVFRYSRGIATYTVTHCHLFALSRNVGFRVEADEKGIERKPAAREIDLKGYMAGRPTNSFEKPTPIANDKDLEVAVPDKEWRAKIAKQVDFAHEKLLFFAWAGSRGDELSFTTEEGKSGRVVVFQFQELQNLEKGAKLAEIYRDMVNALREARVLESQATDQSIGQEKRAELQSSARQQRDLAENKRKELEKLGIDFAVVSHFHLFAVAKNTVWRVDEAKELPRAAPAVREIDLNGFKADRPKGAVDKPTEIGNGKDLEAAIPNEEWRVKIAKQVDFAKEKLLFFSWGGSGGDQVWFATVDGKSIPAVVFRYCYGPDPDYVAHYQLYALAKDTQWRVEKSKTPAERPALNKDDPTEKLLTALDDKDAFVRAAAIDLLGERKAKEAIPKLIELLADGTALIGSDNYVGSHAAAALSKITGRPFSTDQKEWNVWFSKQAKEEPRLAAGSGVKVLSAEATVELNGLLADTPKGVFLMVQEERLVPGLHGTENKLGAVAWELDFSKSPELAKQAKELSGKAVVVVGTCKMVPAPAAAGGGIAPIEGSGSDELLGIRKGALSDKWEIQRIVTVTKLSGGEKK